MFIVDRFEGEWAIVEYQNKTFNIPKELLPNTIKEGDIINIEITINTDAREERKNKIKELMDDLFNP